MDNRKPLVGQLVVQCDEEGYWNYFVVVVVFDDRYEIKNIRTGRSCMIITGDETRQKMIEAKMLSGGKTDLMYQDGQPVMCRKTIFGNWVLPKGFK